MAESRHPARPGGFLSAVVADSRAMMPRRPALFDHEMDGPPALAGDAALASSSPGEAHSAPEAGRRDSRMAPGVSRSRVRASLPPDAMENPAAERPPSAETRIVEMRGDTFEVDAVAPERRGAHEAAPIDPTVAASAADSIPSSSWHKTSRVARRPEMPAGAEPIRPEPLDAGPPSETSARAIHPTDRAPEQDASPVTGQMPPPSPAPSPIHQVGPTPRMSRLSPSSGFVAETGAFARHRADPHSERARIAETAELAGENVGDRKGTDRLASNWREAALSERGPAATRRNDTPDGSARNSDAFKEHEPAKASTAVTQTAAHATTHATAPTSSATKPADIATLSQTVSSAAPRAPMNLTRPQRVAPQGPGVARAPAAPPSVHIGTIDVRIEAPKPRAEAPPRQPVNYSGSGVLSRLYLRGM